MVIVLGDAGRSPRMLNHVRALRDRGWRVTLAGYGPTPLPFDLADDGRVHRWIIDAGRGGRLGAWLRLAMGLLNDASWDAALVQNPPGFPALFAAWFGRCGRSAVLALDWHNEGAGLLRRRSLAGFYAWCERTTARLADDHWTVSAAFSNSMKPYSATVVYDRPSRRFIESIQVTEPRAAWWKRVWPDQPLPAENARWVVAPSSWTADENHAALLRVAAWWREHASAWRGSPVAVIATGRGAGRAAFELAVAMMGDGPVSIHFGWVPQEEYPSLLAHADAGLCLHTSSSGLDLPMKLADFRGAGLPALAWVYGPVLDEIFRDGVHGAGFRDEEGLAAALHTLAVTAKDNGRLRDEPGDTWEDEWTAKLGRWAERVENENTII